MVALNRWNGYKFQFQGTNRVFLTVRTIRPAGDTNYINQDGTLSLDTLKWYHVVATYKPGEMNFYVNGTLTHSWTGVDAPGNPIAVDNTINFVIGQDLPTNKYTTSLVTDPNGDFYVNYGGFFTGDLDDVMFYNIALDRSPVESIFAESSYPLNIIKGVIKLRTPAVSKTCGGFLLFLFRINN